MNLAILGTGYVGLVTAACLADFGHAVRATDKDRARIERLRCGNVPIYEPGLEDLVRRNAGEGRLRFTDELSEALDEAQAVFIAVGTPPLADGRADLSQVEASAAEVARHLRDYKVIVNKSTVPVGTGRRVAGIIRAHLGASAEFDVVSNPEFLREGAAVNDFMRPDRVVVGTESERAERVMKEIYRALYLIETPFVWTNLETAELIKYATNAFLATKIGFINEIANLCEAVGAEVRQVARGLGLDGRIGPKFLHAGPGYGGSCLPKDTRALSAIARAQGTPVTIVDAVIAANERQKERMVREILKGLRNRHGTRIVAVLGASFKPNTDDIRESPSVFIIERLLAAGVAVRLYDPAAMDHCRSAFGARISYGRDAYETACRADAIVLATEWNQFRRLDLPRIKRAMRGQLFFDLRSVYEPEEVRRAGLEHVCVGRASGFLNRADRECADASENPE